MSKVFILTCVVIVAILALGQGVTQANNRLAAIPNAAPTEAATQQAANLSNGWTLAAQQAKQDIPDPKLTVTIIKPILSGPSDIHIDHFNAAVDYLSAQIIESFQVDLKQLGTPSPTMPTDLPGSFIEVNYQVFTATQHLVSIQFHVLFYATGAAHPNSYTVPINYDFDGDRILTLADVFQPKVDYLKVLSDYSVQVLKKQPDIFQFPDGASAKDENYRSWNITPDGIQITFDPYQVAAYAAGPQQVLVPYSTLKPVINPTGPLASFVK